MPLLVRKINLAKWKQTNFTSIGTDDVSADAITNCLKTKKNTLSVWRIATLKDLDNAVLALIANCDHLDKIDVVLLDEKLLLEHNIEVESTPGLTPIESLVNTHRDISKLSFQSIGIVKDFIVKEIEANNCIRYTVGKLKKLLKSAINNGILPKESLKDSIKKKLK